MSFFNILANAAEDNSKLGAQAIDVAHRTHNGLLDAVGLNNFLPNPVKHLADGVYDTNKNIVLGVGNTTAGILRKVGGTPSRGQGSSHQLPEHETHDGVDNTHIGYGSNGERDDDDNDDEDRSDEDRSDEEDDDTLAESAAPPHHFGAVPDLPDSRDHRFHFDPNHSLSHVVDLRGHCPPVYNQGHMGSCTAHAVAGAFEFSVMKQNLPHFSPSRLFIWYNARAKSKVRNAVKKNVGSSLRISIQSLAPKANGVCSEEDWSYEVCKYNERTKVFVAGAKAAQKPPPFAVKHAHQHASTGIEYKRVSTKTAGHLPGKLMQCLDKGVPFVFGMNHSEILKDASMEANGWVPSKPPKSKNNKGNPRSHSLLAVGYFKEEKLFIVRNSWGENWGDKGHFYMPFDLLYLCFDFWSVKVVVPRADHK